MTSEAPEQQRALFSWWRETATATRRLTIAMVIVTGVVLGVAIALLPSQRSLPWWAVLPVLWLGAVLSARRVTTAGLHRGGREVLILPVGQYLFAAALLLDPISIAVLAVTLPSLRPPPRSILVRCSRVLTMLAGSATYWLLIGEDHPRIDGDESWWLVVAILAAMIVHTLAESALVSVSARVTVGASPRDTNIWTPYHALRDLWELAIGAVGAVLALVDPPLVLLMIPVAVLAVEHIRLEGETQQSRVDPRTELLNVRGFEELAAKEIERATALDRPLCLLVADLDHLREINNAHGHRAGDAVISVVGRRILASTRRDDVVARVGGEEFVALLPDVGIDIATRVAERMRGSVADSPVEAPAGRLLATLSVGVAQWRRGETLEQIFDRADAAMYAAKQSGRNRVCCAEDDADEREQPSG
jgi:diguanylate cyclase (GGDEF)-like protein